MSQAIFQSRYATIYNLFYKDKDYEVETEYVCRLLQSFSKHTPRTILDLGCGTGGHDIFLSKKGFYVTGIDQAPEMINQASRHASNKNIEFHVGNIQTLELNKKFDAVVSLFHVMSYQVTASDLLRCFKTAKNHLHEGGAFIFDFWHGAGVLSDPPAIRVKKVENEEFRATRISEPLLRVDTPTIDVKFSFFISDKNVPDQYYSFEESHLLRYWFTWELLPLLQDAGFRNVHVEEWIKGKQLSSQAWYGCIVAS
jgi:SAM-dependent methyltransferase